MISVSKTYNDETEIIAISNIYGIKECQEIYASKNKDQELAKLEFIRKIEALNKDELISIIESEIVEKLSRLKGKKC